MKRILYWGVLTLLASGCIADRTPVSERGGNEVDMGVSHSDAATHTTDAEPTDVGSLSDVMVNQRVDALPGEDVGGLPDMAIAVQYDCPMPRTAPLGAEVEVGDAIMLDASQTIVDERPGSHPVRYEWVVLRRPRGSTALPLESFFDPADPGSGGEEDSPDTPRAWFLVDLEGTYTFELRVGGGGGPESTCPEADPILMTFTTPGADPFIEIIMTWENPEGPAEPGEQSNDVDLHLRHPRALGWGQSGGPYDCFFLNNTPDWGQIGDQRDDPILSIDAEARRREHIFLSNPEDTDEIGDPYLVGAHYYNAFGRLGGEDFGPVDVRIQIRNNGGQIHDEVHRIGREHLLWEAAEVHIEDGEIRVVGLDRVVEYLR